MTNSGAVNGGAGPDVMLQGSTVTSEQASETGTAELAAPNGYILSVHGLDLTPLGERQLRLPIRLGRSSLNDVPVAHRLVSDFHARVEEVDGRLCVRDLSSKNGVLVEALGAGGAARIAPHTAVDLEPYGFEFLLGPLLRVRVRPASVAAPWGRHSAAMGSVLGNAGGAISLGAAFAEDERTEAFSSQPAAHGAPGAPRSAPRPPMLTPAQGLPGQAPRILGRSSPRAALPRGGAAVVGGGPPPSATAAVQPYASVFIEPSSAPLDLPPLPGSAPWLAPVRATPEPTFPTRVSPVPPAARAETLLEQPVAAATAWQASSNGTLPVEAAPATSAYPSLEVLALRGLRELAASLLPGQPVETAGDVIQLVTKLHDALDMFCRCFVPVREACSRFVDPDELERAAAERCRHRSGAYLAVERALDPPALMSALIDWRDDAEDAPQAVEHILADLMREQQALIEGALEGTRALFQELSPARLAAREPPDPSILSRFSGGRERALWEAMAARHAELASAGDGFRELFGDLFGHAYQARASARHRSGG